MSGDNGNTNEEVLHGIEAVMFKSGKLGFKFINSEDPAKAVFLLERLKLTLLNINYTPMKKPKEESKILKPDFSLIK